MPGQAIEADLSSATNTIAATIRDPLGSFSVPGPTNDSHLPRRALKPWLREFLLIAPVYVMYSVVRNQFGSAKLAIGGAPVEAFNNAVRIIDLEKALGLFHELAIQRWFLHSWFVTFFNIFYGTAHFAVTVGVLIWLYVRRHHSFRRWRTTLMITTALALIGFAFFPLMPPRLINVSSTHNRYGGGELAQAQDIPDYGFVDTLREGHGLWNFDSEGMDSVSNQFAAMPSLHIGWSMWCAIVLWNFGRRRSTKILGAIYPVVTLVTIVATANHYLIDAVGGAIALGIGYALARLVQLAFDRRRARHHV
jgi:hypothetical protein